MADESTNEVITAYQANFGKAFGSSRYSDLTIKYDDVEFGVHKVILCTQVKFFENACNGEFKESAQNVIDLSADAAEFGPAAVRALLEFCYSCNYDETAKMTTQPHPCQLDIQAYGIAAKYDVIGLQKYAASKFKGNMGELWKNRYFDEAVSGIYKTNDVFRDLREIIAEATREHIGKVGKRDGFAELLSTEGCFAKDVVHAFFAMIPKRYDCSYCGRAWTPGLDVPVGEDMYHCAHCGKRYSARVWRYREVEE